MSKLSLSLSADDDINAKLQARQNQQKSQYDRASKTLPAIHPDDSARVLNPHYQKLEPGIVKCSGHTPRSYVITMANGGTLRRNRIHIRPTGENICIQHNSSSDGLPMPLNAVPDATPSTLPNERTPTCKHTTLGSEVPANTPQVESPAADAPPHRSSRIVKPPDRLD